MTDEVKSPKRSRNQIVTGLLIIALSPIFAVSPFLIALPLATLLCGPDANEANCGWAALPWFMYFTIPAALVMLLTGVIITVIGIFKINKRAS
jgi:hypothetical protein